MESIPVQITCPMLSPCCGVNMHPNSVHLLCCSTHPVLRMCLSSITPVKPASSTKPRVRRVQQLSRGTARYVLTSLETPEVGRAFRVLHLLLRRGVNTHPNVYACCVVRVGPWIGHFSWFQSLPRLLWGTGEDGSCGSDGSGGGAAAAVADWMLVWLCGWW